MPYSADDRRFLYGLLRQRFSRDELATLAAIDLGLEPDDFPQETRPTFCRALVLHHERRGRVRALVLAILDSRPDQSLPEADRTALEELLARLANEAPREPDLDPTADGTFGGVTLSAATLSVGGDVVGGDKVTIIQHLTALPGVLTDYGPRIKNFLHEYLGDSQQRIPFGGRERELEALDIWLADETAPPYALLTAEAGRGKSALLVQWATQLEGWGEAHVVFVPVSIRFNTALASVVFTALAARLGEVYGEPIKWADLSADQWRGVCQSYLARTPPDGKRVIVILDGLDEAADWQAGADLFPRMPPAGIRVVVSARYLAGDVDERGWRRRLGWERMELAQSIPLPLLTRTGVAAVLAAMGNPLDALATRVDVVAELFRLSEGDPLLVRLYVEALLPYGEQVAILTPETLRTLEPGLGGYFERWWEDQRYQWGDKAPLCERRVQTVLDLLATALGPLDRDTVLALAPTDAGVTSRTLPDALRPLARFIVGDGQEVGYTFTHPRLGYYFWDALARAEQAQWEARFLAFGEQVLTNLNQGTLAPQNAPAYAVQYHGAHLERAKAPDAAFYALISEGWMRAWEALEGTHAGFLQDVARAWQRADAALATGRTIVEALVQQVRAALCQASVAALSANISAELLALAVQHGLLTPVQALVMVRQAPSEQRRAQMLVRLAPLLPHALRPQALDTACAIGDEESRVEALVSLVPRLSGDDQRQALSEALNAARAIGEERRRAEALTGLVPYLSGDEQRQLLSETLDAARAIRDDQRQMLTDMLNTIGYERRRTDVLARLAPLLDAVALRVALDIAQAIGNEWRRAEALTGLAPYLSGDEQRLVLTEALDAARAIGNEWKRVDVLAELALHLSGNEQHQALTEALDAIRAIEDERGLAEPLTELAFPHYEMDALRGPLGAVYAIFAEWSRAAALVRLAPRLDAAGLRVALDMARAIADERGRAVALTGLAPYLSGDEQRQVRTESLDATRAIRDEETHAITLTGLAPRLDAAGLRVALDMARAVGVATSRVAALTGLAPYLSGSEQRQVLTEALDAARAIGDEWTQAEALTQLAPHLNAIGLRIALDIARAIAVEWARPDLLMGLAPHLNAAGLRIALDMVRAIVNERSRATTLIELVPSLKGDDKQLALTEALNAARAIEEGGIRVATLISLAPHLSGDDQRQALTEALNTARAIGHEESRAAALARLAPHLSGDEKRQTLTEALDVARAIGDERGRAEVLIELAPHLDTMGLQIALGTARAIENVWWKAEALVRLAPDLNEDDQRQALSEALDAVRAIGDDGGRADLLVHLTPHLDTDSLRVALDIARTMGDDESRIDALMWLIPRLSSNAQRQALTEVLDTARALGDEDIRAAALTGLALHHSGDEKRGVLAEALDAVRAIEVEGRRANALTELAPHLDWTGLRVTLDMAHAIGHEESRADALRALAPHLATWAATNRAAAIPHWTTTLHVLARRPRPAFLADLAALLPFVLALAGDEKEQVADGIARAIQEVCSWWP